MNKEDFIKLVGRSTEDSEQFSSPSPQKQLSPSFQEQSSPSPQKQPSPSPSHTGDSFQYPSDSQTKVEQERDIPGLSSISPLSYEEVTLASRGLFYDESSYFSRGKVKMKYMTTQQEDILASPSLIKKGTVFDILLKSVLMLPPNTKYEELLIGDKNSLLFALRIMNYGSNYPCTVVCPNCSAKNEKEIDLSMFTSVYMTEEELAQLEGVERVSRSMFKVYLDKSKTWAIFKLPNIEDEAAINKEIQAVSGKTGGEIQSNITTRLKRLVVDIGGEKNKGKLFQMILSLPFQDSQKLRKMIKKLNPDIDTTFDFSCNVCGHEDKLELPINANFFWPEL